MTLAATAPARSVAAPLVVLVIAGCILAIATNGIRNTFGLFTLPLTGELGMTRETWGMAMAIQNLAWGIMQPFAGAWADRYGTARVVAGGLGLFVIGLVLTAVSPTGSFIWFTAGVLCGAGFGMSGFSIIMLAFGRNVPLEKRSVIFGVATAASSFGQFLFAPISQGFIAAFGWQSAMIYLGVILAVVAPLTVALRGRAVAAQGVADLPVVQALRRAWRFGSYRLLVVGFFVCGFHLAFVTVHMPAYLVQCGLPPEVASWAIAVVGLFNIVGSLSFGYLGSKLPKQLLLATIYLTRALAFAAFALMPVTTTSALIFSGAMGLLWLSTVPLTAGLVSHFFGTRYMGLLYGIAFLSHQVGAFVGVWLGGYVYDATGSYSLMWYLSVLLGLGAAAVHIPIREAEDARFQPAAA